MRESGLNLLRLDNMIEGAYRRLRPEIQRTWRRAIKRFSRNRFAYRAPLFGADIWYGSYRAAFMMSELEVRAIKCPAMAKDILTDRLILVSAKIAHTISADLEGGTGFDCAGNKTLKSVPRRGRIAIKYPHGPCRSSATFIPAIFYSDIYRYMDEFGRTRKYVRVVFQLDLAVQAR